MSVQVLPDHVINCIAAGEVIDRPAAVVRELVDNAIDAGANDICITLENGGQNLIKVSDNGSGMSRDDALLAFERHATSKLRQAEDLDQISTMGFRGEALAAIAAVSKVLLRTRVLEEQVGQQLVLEAGKLIDVTSVACGRGSEMEVRNLYYNTPARRKFLRQPRTEEQRIKSWVLQTALVRPNIRYRLLADGRELVNLPVRGKILDRAKEYFKGTTVEVAEEFAEMEINGLVAHPALAQADSSSLLIFVNQRLVTDRLLLRAVREGFEHTLKDREYPLGLICVTIPPNQVDVNVHPQKSEVRFRNSQQLFVAMRQAVSSAFRKFRGPIALGKGGDIANDRRDVSHCYKPVTGGAEGIGEVPQQYGLNDVVGSRTPYLDLSSSKQIEQTSESTEFNFSELVFLGQLFECYLLCQKESRFYIVDMHAAHERINYNKLRILRTESNVPTQRLLLPVVVELSEEGLQNCMAHQETFSQFGFEVEKFGDATLMVRSVPEMISADNVQQLVREIAAIWEEGTADGRFELEFDKIAATLACHSSVRAGRHLERQEVAALFSALDLVDFSSACPHGRPVLVEFSRIEVEKWFGRDR